MARHRTDFASRAGDAALRAFAQIGELLYNKQRTQPRQATDGQVTITYDPAIDACPTPLVVAPRFTG